MLIKIPIYIELKESLEPEDVQLLVQDLQKDFSKSIIDNYGRGKITIETSSFADVTIEVLSQVMARNRIKKALGAAQK